MRLLEDPDGVFGPFLLEVDIRPFYIRGDVLPVKVYQSPVSPIRIFKAAGLIIREGQFTIEVFIYGVELEGLFVTLEGESVIRFELIQYPEAYVRLCVIDAQSHCRL